MKTNARAIIEEIQAKAFQEGWNALAGKIADALKSAAPVRLNPPRSKPKKRPYKTNTNGAKIYNYIKANPNMRGKDIIRNTGVENKTARTTLYRMKKRGIATNENGKWKVL
jgi:hypothetical protein